MQLSILSVLVLISGVVHGQIEDNPHQFVPNVLDDKPSVTDLNGTLTVNPSPSPSSSTIEDRPKFSSTSVPNYNSINSAFDITTNSILGAVITGFYMLIM